MLRDKLREKMAEYGDTNYSLAEVLGITPQRNSAKINGTHGADYTCAEIKIIKKRYGLSADEVDEIFFECEVS